MVLASLRSNSCDTSDNERKQSYEPIVLRTYDYPHDDTDSDPEDRSNPLVASSASLSVAKAVAATTALPALVNSIQARLDDRDVTLMDGSLFATCPLHVAIDEARQLFPRRPLWHQLQNSQK